MRGGCEGGGEDLKIFKKKVRTNRGPVALDHPVAEFLLPTTSLPLRLLANCHRPPVEITDSGLFPF